ncbi:hypothetical protein G6F36_012551 [Rhizopus arrhizus]|nr:hypothetical protein G6F36_012551 [Rhizopus arrhizus]
MSSTASTASSSSSALPSSANSNASTPNKGAIVGGVVGGIVGVALIGGFLAFINRRGGFASRSKNRRDGLNKDDYTIDMNQNDFGPSNTDTTAASVTGSAVPMSPFDSRRYAPSPQSAYASAAVPSDPYNDYHEGYSQTGCSQNAYNQEPFHQNGYQQDNYGYYGYDQGYPQQDSQTYYSEQPYMQPQNHYLDPTTPSTVVGKLSEASYQNTADKPNLREYNKPNEA